MICQICQKRQATMHFTNIINNLKISVHLCDVCAKEHGKKGFFFAGDYSAFITGLMGLMGKNDRDTDEPRIICTRCKTTESEFLKQGKLGCEECYTTFSTRLDPLVRRIHGSTKHNGKVPGSFEPVSDTVEDLEKLKIKLEEAVADEKYEEAAVIRDLIRGMEGGDDDGTKGFI